MRKAQDKIDEMEEIINNHGEMICRMEGAEDMRLISCQYLHSASGKRIMLEFKENGNEDMFVNVLIERVKKPVSHI